MKPYSKENKRKTAKANYKPKHPHRAQRHEIAADRKAKAHALRQQARKEIRDGVE